MTYASRRYVNEIHNPLKRSYAVAYAEWIYSGRAEETQPERPAGLSYMAAQAVRMNLDGLQRTRYQMSEFTS